MIKSEFSIFLKPILFLALLFFNFQSKAFNCGEYFDHGIVYKDFNLSWDTEKVQLAEFDIAGHKYKVTVKAFKPNFENGLSGEAIEQALKLQAFPLSAQKLFISELKFLSRLHADLASKKMEEGGLEIIGNPEAFSKLQHDTYASQYYSEMAQVLEGKFNLSLYLKATLPKNRPSPVPPPPMTRQQTLTTPFFQ